MNGETVSKQGEDGSWLDTPALKWLLVVAVASRLFCHGPQNQVCLASPFIVHSRHTSCLEAVEDLYHILAPAITFPLQPLPEQEDGGRIIEGEPAIPGPSTQGEAHVKVSVKQAMVSVVGTGSDHIFLPRVRRNQICRDQDGNQRKECFFLAQFRVSPSWREGNACQSEKKSAGQLHHSQETEEK